MDPRTRLGENRMIKNKTFEVGDLVQISETHFLPGEHPANKFGIVVDVQREFFKSPSCPDRIDRVVVDWLNEDWLTSPEPAHFLQKVE